MNLLQDVITYVRRIIKSPSNAVITDNLIIDYTNRFWMMDVDARLQLFDLKKSYQFQTIPGVDKYNMPLYSVQTEPGSQSIGMFPVYQGFIPPVYINGIQVPFQTQKNQFFNVWPNVVQNLGVVATGSGSAGPYTIQIPLLSGTTPPNPPLEGILRGHIDIGGIIATGNNVDPPVANQAQAASSIASVPVTSVASAFYLTSIDSNGNNVVVADSGWFVDTDANLGYLMTPGNAPFGNTFLPLPGSPTVSSNTVNYLTGEVNVTFPVTIPSGNNINAQCFFFQTGLPRGVLFYNNTLTLRSPPDQQYLVQLDAYLTPAAFLNTAAAIPFGYMAEYIARGAARKLLSDTGDIEQFNFYEPLFREQELLVWKRSQRQWTASRTESIYSQGFGQGAGFNNNYGGGVSL
jgi:hypothetical protein